MQLFLNKKINYAIVSIFTNQFHIAQRLFDPNSQHSLCAKRHVEESMTRLHYKMADNSPAMDVVEFCAHLVGETIERIQFLTQLLGPTDQVLEVLVQLCCIWRHRSLCNQSSCRVFETRLNTERSRI